MYIYIYINIFQFSFHFSFILVTDNNSIKHLWKSAASVTDLFLTMSLPHLQVAKILMKFFLKSPRMA